MGDLWIPQNGRRPPWRIWVAGPLLLSIWLAASTVQAADPTQAAYTHDATKVLWLVHISDTHLGAEIYSDEERFSWFVNEALWILDPYLVINTGDLVDGSPNGIPASGQDNAEWGAYRNILDDAGVGADYYYDLAGNHDGYGSPDLNHYLTHSLSGSTYGSTTHTTTLNTPFGEYFIYGTATPGMDGATFLEHPEFSADELVALENALVANDDAELILVFGHHRPDQPENASAAVDLIAQHSGFYFHGHSHTYHSYRHGDVVVFEIDTLGKGNRNNIAVIAIDNNAVSYAATDSSDPWPFIVPTAPIATRLRSGDENPYAYSVCNSSHHNPVRALVFDQSIISAVTVQCNDATPLSMEQHPIVPQLWTGTFDASGLDPGDATLSFTAYGSQVRTRELTITLADVPCPQPLAPDVDGGGVDAFVDGAADGQTDAAILDGSKPDAPSRDASPVPDGALSGDPAADGCGCRAVYGNSASASNALNSARRAASAMFILCLIALSLIRRKRRRT
jgi:predicted MPP superfamily phosphohydrolase